MIYLMVILYNIPLHMSSIKLKKESIKYSLLKTFIHQIQTKTLSSFLHPLRI
jgi:hypothetical protein